MKKYVFGFGVYGFSLWATYTYYKKPKDYETKTFDSIAQDYNKKVHLDEIFMGILLLRRWLASYAKGETLEFAAGTGRNQKYYSKDLTLTLCDSSPNMLKQATAANKIVADAHNLPFESNSFDTVMGTFTLCSVTDPHVVIAEAIRVLKPGGSLLLLEHGISHYQWINNWLNKLAPSHAAQWGCWHNRDIKSIVSSVKEAKIESLTRFHFGTTYMFRIKKN